MNKTNTAFNASLEIPTSNSGMKNLIKSLTTTPNRDRTPLDNEPIWSSVYVAPDSDQTPYLKLSELGYSKDVIKDHTGVNNDLVLRGPLKLFSDEGIAHLSEIGKKLKVFSVDNDHVISNSTRGAQNHSRYLYDMLRDKNFLLACSRIAGVPLIPHPLNDAAIQVNYYSPESKQSTPKKEISKWHYDGMDYVFTVLLTDKEEYEGGEYIYYNDRRDLFASDPDKAQKLVSVGFRDRGDTLYTLGSMIYHCVTPIVTGHRSTLVISLFCPYLAKYDSNRFWHLAPDDGLLRTTLDWIGYRFPIRDHEYYFRYVNAPRITWEML